MSPLNEKCVKSWKDKCKDYEFMRIDESNFDYSKYEYSRIGYEKKNWAFVSDIARLVALRELGGIYLDTDVELLKPLDSLLEEKAIVHETGYGCLGSGIMGCGEFPKLFQDAWDDLKMGGDFFYSLLTRKAYERYDDWLGDAVYRGADVTILGMQIFASSLIDASESTIGIHWDENTWKNSYTGGTKFCSDFVPFSICNPEYNAEETRKWFGAECRDKVMKVPAEKKIDISVIELGNYFNNPRVVKVVKDGVELAYALSKADGVKEKISESGATIYYD